MSDKATDGRVFVSPFRLGVTIYDKTGEAFIVEEVRFTRHGNYVSASSSDGRTQTFNIGDDFIGKTIFLSPPKTIGGYYEYS